jgi:hypothetical protein
MRFCTLRFNLYFWLAAAGLAVSGCAWWHHDKEPVTILRIHMESESSVAGTTKSISVVRSAPVLVNVTTDPVLTEADVISARLLDVSGGFALELRFDETAAWRLEQSSAANPGKHLAIFAQWSDKPADGRWLAAPIVARRMGDGRLVFTPDASHEEMEKLVNGLNAVAKKNADSKPK